MKSLRFTVLNKSSFSSPVEVIKPKVFIRRIQDLSEKYEPNVTSPFKLVLGEQSKIIRHETNAFNKLHSLMNIPTKPLITFITLNDVQNYDSVQGIRLLP